MFHRRTKSVLMGSFLFFSILLSVHAQTKNIAHQHVTTEVELKNVRGAIQNIENDLLDQNQKKVTASSQLYKIKKLLGLQKKEITISERRIREMTATLQELTEQKENLQNQIAEQKSKLFERLKELDGLTEVDLNNAHWLETFDQMHQREYYLSKIAEKDLKKIELLRKNIDEAQALEIRLIEEKGRLDFYIQELKEQNDLMSANEQVQKELLLSNRANRLETLKNLHELKQAEEELQGILKKSPKMQSTGVGFAKLKGNLSMPLYGKVLTGYGRSYNKKTNLFTFQKGITIATKTGDDVKAVDAGKIAYAGPLKNYRNIVIVEHAGHYYTLYGQLGHVMAKEGDRVELGQTIGQASEDPLYFEIRNKNIAVNPEQWFGKDAHKKEAHEEHN